MTQWTWRPKSENPSCSSLETFLQKSQESTVELGYNAPRI